MHINLLKNLPLKIASLLLAFVIWLLIMNVSDPVDWITVNGIQVTVLNENYLEEKGISYSIDSAYKTVSVRVHANRSITESLSRKNFKAEIDLTQIKDLSEKSALIPVEVDFKDLPDGVASRMGGNALMPINLNVRVNLEEMDSRDFVINASTGDTVPANGYEVGKLVCAQERVTLKGSKSLLGKIDRVMAQVDVSGLTRDRSLTATLHIYDKNGSELTGEQRSSISISTESEHVSVQVYLYKVRSGVSVKALTFGKVEQGYELSSVELTPSEVSVVGDDEALSRLASSDNTITIPSSSDIINISGLTEDKDYTVDITPYLPDGVRLASGHSGTVIVTVNVLPYNSRMFTFDTKDIVKLHLPDNCSAVFAEVQIPLKISGSEQDLNKLNASMIRVYVDLEDVKEGTEDIPVEVKLPAGYSLVEQVTVRATVAELTPTP